MSQTKFKAVALRILPELPNEYQSRQLFWFFIPILKLVP